MLKLGGLVKAANQQWETEKLDRIDSKLLNGNAIWNLPIESIAVSQMKRHPEMERAKHHSS